MWLPQGQSPMGGTGFRVVVVVVVVVVDVVDAVDGVCGLDGGGSIMFAPTSRCGPFSPQHQVPFLTTTFV